MTLSPDAVDKVPPASVAVVRRPPVSARVRACLECGNQHRKSGEFCSAACRHAFGNRRKQRGAELYDLYMAHRFERALAVELRILQAMNRLASNWREEDKRRRDGRRSWRRAKDVLADRPYLRAIVTWDGTGRGRR